MIELKPKDNEAADVLFSESIVVDALGGVARKLTPYKAGITAVNVTFAHPHASFFQTIKAMYLLFTYLEALDDKLSLIKTANDINTAKKTDKLGILLGLQDGSSLDGDLTLLTILYRLGLRVMTLTYNEHNRLGDGCMELHDRGLTSFGKQVIREMNRLGVVLDLSHSSNKTTLDAMEVTTKPPIFSHSNSYELTPSPRCISDRQIKKAAELEGVIGLSVYSPMCYADPNAQPTLNDFLDHVAYVVELVGIDHVGIGTDIFEDQNDNPILWRATTKRRYPEMVGTFERENIYAKGFETYAEFPNVVYGLKDRGYTDSDIKKVLGGNFLRVFKANFQDTPS